MNSIVLTLAIAMTMCPILMAQHGIAPDSAKGVSRQVFDPLPFLNVPFFQSYSDVIEPDGHEMILIHVDKGIPKELIEMTFGAFLKPGTWTYKPSAPIVALASPAVADSMRNGSGCFAGTVGALIKDNNGSGYLTSNHVAAAEGTDLCPNGSMSSPSVTQERVPSKFPAAKCKSEPIIGHLDGFVPIDYSSPGQNLVDAAVVIVDNKFTVDMTNACHVCFNGKTAVASGNDVFLCARGQQVHGKVKSVSAAVQVRYGLCGPPVGFMNQIEIAGDSGPFAFPGDSGTVVYTLPDANGKAKIVGLIFAGTVDGRTYANPIDAILGAKEMTDLGVTLSFCP
jgi:hypothetical protein